MQELNTSLEENTTEIVNLQDKVEEFLINRDKEETNMTLDFAKALLALELEIKEIKNDQKAIKTEAKDNGVSVSKVTKALNILKAAMKANDQELLELETIENVLGNDVDIKTQISELIRKD
jgi:uncharacterized protein (UPF0335 family)